MRCVVVCGCMLFCSGVSLHACVVVVIIVLLYCKIHKLATNVYACYMYQYVCMLYVPICMHTVRTNTCPRITTQAHHHHHHVHPPSYSPPTQQHPHQACHEANAGPWTRLAANTGAHLTWWPVDPHTRTSSLHTLETLLKPNTAVVALTHVSNLLGEVLDVRAVVDMVRSKAPGARVVVDGVAYAPHRAIDVRAWDVDWYAFSSYKVPCGGVFWRWWWYVTWWCM